MKQNYLKIEKINTLCEGKYLKLKEVFFDYKGVKKRWEMVDAFESVGILIYDKDLDSIIMVKQFRLPLYMQSGEGYSYEICAGLCDKDKPNEIIAKEEVLEECGYDIDEKDLEIVTTTWGCVGNQASKQTIYYVEVTQEQKVSSGGGVDDESIEVVEIPSNKVEELIFSKEKISTPGAKFALMWWIHYKVKS